MVFPMVFPRKIGTRSSPRPHHAGPAPWFLGPGGAHPDLDGSELAHVGDCVTSTGGGADLGDRSTIQAGRFDVFKKAPSHIPEFCL